MRAADHRPLGKKPHVEHTPRKSGIPRDYQQIPGRCSEKGCAYQPVVFKLIDGQQRGFCRRCYGVLFDPDPTKYAWKRYHAKSGAGLGLP